MDGYAGVDSAAEAGHAAVEQALMSPGAGGGSFVRLARAASGFETLLEKITGQATQQVQGASVSLSGSLARIEAALAGLFAAHG